MTKIPNSRAAAKRYEIATAKDGYRYPVVPDDYGPVHALLFDPPLPGPSRRQLWPEWRNRTQGNEFLRGWEPEEAACGRGVRLVFPVSFDLEEEDVCPACHKLATLWVMDRAAFDREVEDRWRRRAAREHRRQEAAESEEALDDFVLRQARALGDIPPDGDWDDMFRKLDDREIVWPTVVDPEGRGESAG